MMQRGWGDDCQSQSPEVLVKGGLTVGYRLKSGFEVCTIPGRFSLTEMDISSLTYIFNHIWSRIQNLSEVKGLWAQEQIQHLLAQLSVWLLIFLQSNSLMWLSVQQASCQTWKEKKEKTEFVLFSLGDYLQLLSLFVSWTNSARTIPIDRGGMGTKVEWESQSPRKVSLPLTFFWHRKFISLQSLPCNFLLCLACMRIFSSFYK